MHFFFGFSAPAQTFESAKSPVTCAPISIIDTLPWLAAVMFFGLLFFPNFAAKVAELGATASAAATVGIGVGVIVAVAVAVAVRVEVAVGDGVAVAVAVRVAVADAVAVAVAVRVEVAVADAVTVAVAVRVEVAVTDAVGEAVAVAVAVRVEVAVAGGVAVAAIDGLGVGVGSAELVAAGVEVDAVPGVPSPASSNIPHPWVAAKTTPLRFCSISKTATAGITPRLKAAQVDPPSVVLKTPMSVAASIVFAVGSLRSTSNRNTGTSGSASAGGGI